MIKPVQTITGNPLPVWDKYAATGAYAAGTLVFLDNTSGTLKWTVAAGGTSATQSGTLGIVMHTTVADTQCAVCLCTPDVIFEATVTAAITNDGPLEVDVTNQRINNVNAAIGSEVLAYVYEYDSTNSLVYVSIHNRS